jgi:hypothetical protein
MPEGLMITRATWRSTSSRSAKAADSSVPLVVARCLRIPSHTRVSISGAGTRAMLPASALRILQKRMRDIIPVTHAAFVRMRRAHAVAAVIKKAASQNGGRTPEPNLPGNGIGGALGLHGFEQLTGEDRLMLAAMHLASIDDLADVEPVLEQMGKRSHRRA